MTASAPITTNYNFLITSFIHKLIGVPSGDSELDTLIKQSRVLKVDIEKTMKKLSDYTLSGKKEILREDVVHLLFDIYGLMHHLDLDVHETRLIKEESEVVNSNFLTNYELIKNDFVKVNRGSPSISQEICLISFLMQLSGAVKKHISDCWANKQPVDKKLLATLSTELLAFTYKLGVVCNYQLDVDFVNFTKYRISSFDSTQKDALITQAMYHSFGVQSYYKQRVVRFNNEETVWYVTFSSCDQTDNNGVYRARDTLLKSFNAKVTMFE